MRARQTNVHCVHCVAINGRVGALRISLVGYSTNRLLINERLFKHLCQQIAMRCTNSRCIRACEYLCAECTQIHARTHARTHARAEPCTHAKMHAHARTRLDGRGWNGDERHAGFDGGGSNSESSEWRRW